MIYLDSYKYVKRDVGKKLVEASRSVRGSDSEDHKDKLIEIDNDFLNKLMQSSLMVKCKQFL